MTNDNTNKSSKPGSENSSDKGSDVSAPSSPTPKKAEVTDNTSLSKEEQMARFEEALKDEDWGHQPC